MADLKAQLEISADASGVEAGVTKAKRSLKDLGTTATTAGKQAADGLSEMGKGGDQASRKIDVATRSMSNSIQRQIALMEAGARGSREYYEALARQRNIDTNAIKPLLDQLDSVAAKQGNVEMSSRQMAFAMRQVPAQFTDIVTSLQAGQAPMTVLIQQGGQLKDSLGGVGPAAKALGGYVMGLINPFTLAAGAAAGLAYAYYQGSKEATAYNKALVLTGNAAGTTVSQLQDMASRMDDVVGTQSAAAAALTEFASNGNIAAQSMERFATVAVRLERETGQAVKETAKQFEELGKSPVAASIKLNETTRFLTLSIYQQIKALEEQGRVAEAAALAQNSFADALDSRMNELSGNLGFIERSWRSIKDAVSEAADAILDVGRPLSNYEEFSDIASQMEEAQAKIDRLNKSTFARPSLITATQEELDILRQRYFTIQEQIRAEEDRAKLQKEEVDRVKAKAAFDKEGEKYLENKKKLEREIADARAQGIAAGATQEEIETRIGQIKEKYSKESTKFALQIDKAQLSSDLSTIKNASEELLGTYANSEKVMEAMRSAGLINDSDYYESKRAFINLETQAKEEALKQEIARLQQEKLSGKERIENDRKIAEAQAEIAKLREQSATELETLTIKETQSANRLKTAYEEAEAAARSYLDTLRLQQQRELDGMGLGNRNRDRNRGRAQIEDRYNQQLLQLESDKRRGAFDGREEDYQAELDRIRRFQGEALSSYNSYYDQLIEKQSSFSLGASEALQNYLDDSQNVFKQSEDLASNAFRGMEDAIVKFATTGKLSFKDLADSILADMVRMQAKSLLSNIFGGSNLLSGLSGLFGGGDAYTANLPDLGGLESWAASFDGGGYTGDGSRSGGIDGKGGFLSILHPKETVVDHTKGQSAGKSVTISPTYSINIDGTTDMARNREMIRKEIQAGNARMVDDLQRAGVI